MRIAGEGSGANQEAEQSLSPGDQPDRIALYVFPRQRATIYGLGVGILVGIGNSFLALDFSFRWELAGTLAAAIVTVLLLHEGLHGSVGRLLGHRPIFGVEPPLVFTTFRERIARGHFMVIALAPLVVLDALFISLYVLGVLRLFMDLCFAVNTIGAVGDVWIALKLIRQPRGSYVEDTQTGIEVWAVSASVGRSETT